MSTSDPVDMHALPPLGVEVLDQSTLLTSRLVLASNWFSVDGLRITRRDRLVTLHRHGKPSVSSCGGNTLFVGERRLTARKVGFWRPVWTLALGDGRSLEITGGGRGVYRHVRVLPEDARLDVIDRSGGFGRACRIDLVGGRVDTEAALYCLVYFLAELEEAYRFNP